MYTKDEKEKLWEMEEIDRKTRTIKKKDEGLQGPEHKHNSLNEKKKKKEKKGKGNRDFLFLFLWR